ELRKHSNLRFVRMDRDKRQFVFAPCSSEIHRDPEPGCIRNKSCEHVLAFDACVQYDFQEKIRVLRERSLDSILLGECSKSLDLDEVLRDFHRIVPSTDCLRKAIEFPAITCHENLRGRSGLWRVPGSRIPRRNCDRSTPHRPQTERLEQAAREMALGQIF